MNTTYFPETPDFPVNIQQLPKLESGRIDLPEYVRRHSPDRLGLIERILSRIEFSPFFDSGGRLIVDLSMPMNVGGYYTYGSKVKYIAVNPILLAFGSESEIAHVLVHEGLHAGVYTNGTELPEEVVTETMAKQAMDYFYGGTELQTGYDSMVDEMAPYFGAMTFPELVMLIEHGTEETFDNFLELVVIGPLLDSVDPHNFSYQSIQSALRDKWPMLKRLFPRMLSMIEGRQAEFDSEAHMDASAYKMEGLLRKAATRLVATNRLYATISAILEEANVASLTEALAVLHLEGFTYLIDFKGAEIYEIISRVLQSSAINIEP